ncbi:transposase [Geitlerinema sp. PCC 9228]|uniref:REP-associated tyrosine transposase n=1 Tax=Geitlerinema sp. PCC 9228 TaxID=111611 RepID=UPI0008F9E3CF|nr:transposase [Geitlerinema sp. PCC 9228]
MANYRRAWIPGGTFFLTMVTYQRKPLFENSDRVENLRKAIAQVKQEMPFDIIAAVVLPDHLHFIWKLPLGDANFSRRVGRLKVLFTRYQFGESVSVRSGSASRRKHRESDVWQRRFWEHTIRNETELNQCLDYIHYNPVKHGYVSYPHQWKHSSFHRWVKLGYYSRDWGCPVSGNTSQKFDFKTIEYFIRE